MSQTVVTEDPTIVVGRTLKRAKQVVFDLPDRIERLRKDARDAYESHPDYRDLRQARSVVRAHRKILGDETTSDAMIVASFKTLRDNLSPKVKELADSCATAKVPYQTEIDGIKTDLKAEKEELRKDFASDTIMALLQ